MFKQSSTGFELNKMLQLKQKRALCKYLYQTPKKLVLVLTSSALMIEASKKDVVILDWVVYIYYLIWFKKSKVQV